MDETISLDETARPADLAAKLANERAADIVEALNRLDAETAAAVLLHLPAERAIEVLDLPGLDGVADIVPRLPTERAVPLLTGMSPDRIADVFRQMVEPGRSQLLQRLDTETQASLTVHKHRIKPKIGRSPPLAVLLRFLPSP